MAASKTQGSYVALFWTGITVLCAGIAYFAFGFGKLVLLLGLVGTAISLAGFMKLKPFEGKTAGVPGRAAMKLLGIVVTWGGWFITVSGLHITPSLGGRLIFALVGIAVSLYGIIGVLATAFGRSVAKAQTSTSFAAIKTTMEHSR
jgi:hypothetical protein